MLLSLMTLFEEFHARKLDIKREIFAHVVLIPKKKGANRVHGFRPIRLLNVIYKVITKVLTNRLKIRLHLLIGPSQIDFIKGRFITDGVATISYCHNKRKLNGVVFRLDFTKA